MNLESRMKADLVDAIHKLGAYARRREDRYAVGLLDLEIKFRGYPHVLAEGKIVEHQKFAPSLRQYEDGRRYGDAGGLAILIGWDKATKAMFIHEWAKEAFKSASWPPGGSGKDHAQTLKDWLTWRTQTLR